MKKPFKKWFWMAALAAVVLAALPAAYARAGAFINRPAADGTAGAIPASYSAPPAYYNPMMQYHWQFMGPWMRSMMSGMWGYGMGGMMGGFYGYNGTGTGNSPAPGTAPQNQGARSAAGNIAAISLKVLPGGKKGPDGKMHDAFAPADFTLKEETPVRITIYNYDNMPHSLTAPELGLNIQAAVATADGRPGVTTVTFTPTKAGDFHWFCTDPCDLENGGWAMNQDGYMQGTIHVQA